MTEDKIHRAIVLTSGGLDSSTTLAIAIDRGYETHAISFDYGQRHKLELQAARKIASALGARSHLVVRVDLTSIGGSALTDEIPVPKGRKTDEMQTHIPVTYVPARNTVFLSLALAWAEVKKAENIFIGVNALDYSGYPDCRPEYIEAYEKMANLALKETVTGEMKIRIHAPLIKMTKAEIIKTGTALGVDFGLTWSCYDPTPDGSPCGLCDSCILRRKGFEEAGIKDPLSG